MGKDITFNACGQEALSAQLACHWGGPTARMDRAEGWHHPVEKNMEG